MDDEYDNDGGIDMYEDRSKRGSREQQAQRSKAAQVSDMRRMQSAHDRCPFCFNSQVSALAPRSKALLLLSVLVFSVHQRSQEQAALGTKALVALRPDASN